MIRRPAAAVLVAALLLAAGCMEDAEGPLEGVLVVYPAGSERMADSVSTLLQRTVQTIDPEPVFSFAFCTDSAFAGTLRSRRTILFLAERREALPTQLRDGAESRPPGMSGRGIRGCSERCSAVSTRRRCPTAWKPPTTCISVRISSGSSSAPP